MTRRIVASLVLALTVIGLTAACTPEEIAFWQDFHAQESAAAGSCHAAVDRVWPAGKRAWAHKIVDRESGGNPGARNRSGASGCFQMMMPMHTRFFNAVGCSGGQWSNAMCNTKAALVLYQQAGTSPWRATSY